MRTGTSVAAIAGVLIAAIAVAGCGSTASGGTPTSAPPTAAPPTAAPPTAAPSYGDPVDVAEDDAVLSPGRYRWHPFEDQPSLTVVADIPNGWRSIGALGMTALGGADAPVGVGIAFLRTDSIFSDPCHWDVDGTGNDLQPGDVSAGSTVADLVAALRANTSYTSTEPRAVTFGQYAGSELTIQVPPSLDLRTCDNVPGDPHHRWFFFSGDGAVWAQGTGNRWTVTIVDVGGTRLIIPILDFEATPAAVHDAAKAIVASMVFTP